jgi:hypothetical protein
LLTKLKGKIEVPFGRMLGNFRKWDKSTVLALEGLKNCQDATISISFPHSVVWSFTAIHCPGFPLWHTQPLELKIDVLNSLKSFLELGMDAHACNSSCSGGEDWEDCRLKAALAKSLWDPISTNKSWMWWVCSCHLSYLVSINRQMVVQVDWAQINVKPHLKNKPKRTRGIAHVVHHLLIKQALRSNSSITTWLLSLLHTQSVTQF